MRIRILGLFCFGLMASLATSTQAAFNYVVDGTFATPPQQSGFATFSNGTTFGSAWTVTNGSLTGAGLGSVDLLSPGYFGTAPGGAGAQSVDLDGTLAGGPTAGGITQTISGLNAGQSYTIDFFYALNTAATSASFTESIDGQSVTLTTTNKSPSFLEFTSTFTAIAGTNTLSFISNDPTTDQSGAIIANVSITGPTAVPEPASLAMLGLGLLAVGGVVRARRRAA